MSGKVLLLGSLLALAAMIQRYGYRSFVMMIATQPSSTDEAKKRASEFGPYGGAIVFVIIMAILANDNEDMERWFLTFIGILWLALFLTSGPTILAQLGYKAPNVSSTSSRAKLF